MFEDVNTWIGVVIGALSAAVPLVSYIVAKTPTKKDDEFFLKAISVIEGLVKKDLNNDGKIGS